MGDPGVEGWFWESGTVRAYVNSVAHTQCASGDARVHAVVRRRLTPNAWSFSKASSMCGCYYGISCGVSCTMGVCYV